MRLSVFFILTFLLISCVESEKQKSNTIEQVQYFEVVELIDTVCVQKLNSNLYIGFYTFNDRDLIVSLYDSNWLKIEKIIIQNSWTPPTNESLVITDPSREVYYFEAVDRTSTYGAQSIYAIARVNGSNTFIKSPPSCAEFVESKSVVNIVESAQGEKQGWIYKFADSAFVRVE